MLLVCFQLRIRSAIYSASGGAIWSEPDEQLQQFGLNRCNGSVQPPQPPNRRDGLQTAVGGAVWIRLAERVRWWGGSNPDSGAGMLVTHTRETRFKKNQAG